MVGGSKTKSGTKTKTKKASANRFQQAKLTKKQTDIYLDIVSGITNSKILAQRHKTTPRNIRRYKEILREKNYLDTKASVLPPPVRISGTKTSDKKSKFWRWHNLHFVLRPYYFYPRYKKIMDSFGNYAIRLGDWEIKLHDSIVEVQLRRDVSFDDPDKYKAVSKGDISFKKVLREAEQRYGFEVVKSKKVNISMVNSHLAFLSEDEAKVLSEEFVLLQGGDGKVWFTVDKSTGRSEYEYIGSKSSFSDSEKLEPTFNYIRDYPDNTGEVFSLKDLVDTVRGLVESQRLLVRQLSELQGVRHSRDASLKNDGFMKVSERPDYVR